jgi:hypothetical protein
LVIDEYDVNKPLLEAEINSIPFSKDALENSSLMLSRLAAIGQRLSCNLRYPDIVNQSDFQSVDLIYHALATKEVEDRKWRFTDRLPIPVDAAREMLHAWRQGKQISFTATNYMKWTFQNSELPIEPTKTMMDRVEPAKDLEIIEQAQKRWWTELNPPKILKSSSKPFWAQTRIALWKSRSPESAPSTSLRILEPHANRRPRISPNRKIERAL